MHGLLPAGMTTGVAQINTTRSTVKVHCMSVQSTNFGISAYMSGRRQSITCIAQVKGLPGGATSTQLMVLTLLGGEPGGAVDVLVTTAGTS